jgi:hypothetical protein
MKLKYFIPIFALATATAANALPFKLAPHGEFEWLWADGDGISNSQIDFEDSDIGLRGQLGAIIRKTVVADLFVQTGIVAGGAFAQYKNKPLVDNHYYLKRGHFGIPLRIGYTFINRINVQAGTQFNMEHSDTHYVNHEYHAYHAEFDFTAGVSYNITENNELGIKLTIRPNETALGVSYNYWIF